MWSLIWWFYQQSLWVVTLEVIVVSLVFKYFEKKYREQVIDNFHGKYVFITGCDSGFGKGAAKRLNSMGCHVIAGCLTQEGAAALERECSHSQKMKPILIDVTKSESVKDAYDEIRSYIPPNKGLWAVINNAGIIGTVGPSSWLHKQDYQTVFDVNILGMCDVTNTFLPLLRKEKGRIVNTASIVGMFALPYAGGYSMTKYAVESFSDTIRRELIPFGISVSIVEPGTHNTNLINQNNMINSAKRPFDRLPEQEKEIYGEEFLKKVIKLGIDFIPKLCPDTNDDVVAAYVHAVTSQHPRHRYLVGIDAHLTRYLAILPSYISDFIFWISGMLIQPAKQE